ncbi:MFS transporter [Streptomyces sp. NA04227]|uniref:MFS transporter n=1 Tax=Streptomyces sp. NA04227 TaxID=2742136 RepID=UPI001590A109|nr:MFS transporter [Streptomyces sp. NA04227]QKW05040.1 MFS transporter [Streptomyces sp. NA04227]
MPLSYRRLFSVKGAGAFTAAGFLARLALAMTGVSTVVMIASLRDSYALAGLVAGASLATTLVTMPLLGRLVDRHGQAKVAVPAALWSFALSGALVACAAAGAPTWTLFVTGVLSATAPNIGGMARARWSEIFDGDPDAMHVANSFEQVLDELGFILGPILAIALCTAVAPEAGRITALVLTLVGTVLFAAQRGTQPPVRPAEGFGARSPFRSGGVRIMMLVFVFVGAVFGSLELATVAYTESLGHGASAGVVLALQAVGSALSGVLFGMLPLRGGHTARFVAGVAGMAVLMSPLNLAGDIGPLCALMFLAGMATSPTMITGMSLVQELVPRSQLNEGMTLAVTGLLAGISLGGTAAGWSVEHCGPDTAYRLPTALAATALVIALLGARRLRGGLAPSAARASTSGDQPDEEALRIPRVREPKVTTQTRAENGQPQSAGLRRPE